MAEMTELTAFCRLTAESKEKERRGERELERGRERKREREGLGRVKCDTEQVQMK